MPRFTDLLEYLASPGLEDIWVLLDIKVHKLVHLHDGNKANALVKLDNNPDDIMRLIGSTLAQVKPTKPWNQRIVLGCWAVSH